MVEDEQKRNAAVGVVRWFWDWLMENCAAGTESTGEQGGVDGMGHSFCMYSTI